MDKEEFRKLVKDTDSDLNGRAMNFGTFAYMILKTLELKEKGISSEDFEITKTSFGEDLGKKW